MTFRESAVPSLSICIIKSEIVFTYFIYSDVSDFQSLYIEFYIFFNIKLYNFCVLKACVPFQILIRTE